MSPFTHLLGRLVELLGAQSAAQLVREFAGQTIQFPITSYYDTTARNEYGFPVNAHLPLSLDEAIEISFRLLASAHKCCAPIQIEPLPAAESPVTDVSCITHPDQCTAPLHKPVAVQPSSEQELHKHPVVQPVSLSVPQSSLES